MNRLQKTYAKRISIGVFVTGCLFAGYLSSAPLRQMSVDPADPDTPQFKIIERNMILDTAILSVETAALGTSNARKIARYLTEEHIKDSRDAASIYFYKPEANLAKDEPVHKIAWKKSSGYELEY